MTFFNSLFNEFIPVKLQLFFTWFYSFILINVFIQYLLIWSFMSTISKKLEEQETANPEFVFLFSTFFFCQFCYSKCVFVPWSLCRYVIIKATMEPAWTPLSALLLQPTWTKLNREAFRQVLPLNTWGLKLIKTWKLN